MKTMVEKRKQAFCFVWVKDSHNERQLRGSLFQTVLALQQKMLRFAFP